MRTTAPAAATHRALRDRAARPYVLNGHAASAPALPGGLYLVATPIGNLRDITVRALEVLAAADLIACEDTRVTRKLLDHFGITTPLTPYHEHNAAEARPKLIARLAEDAAIALVSDAGTSPRMPRSRWSRTPGRRSYPTPVTSSCATRARRARA